MRNFGTVTLALVALMLAGPAYATGNRGNDDAPRAEADADARAYADADARSKAIAKGGDAKAKAKGGDASANAVGDVDVSVGGDRFEDRTAASAASLYASECTRGLSGQAPLGGGAIASADPFCHLLRAAVLASSAGDHAEAEKLRAEAYAEARSRTGKVRRFFNSIWANTLGSIPGLHLIF